MDLQPSPRQQELIELARGLAIANFAPRATQYDHEASFPFADYDDLRAAGLLALCVPTQYGGLGATFETYCLVAEQIAQGNASTALASNAAHSYSTPALLIGDGAWLKRTLYLQVPKDTPGVTFQGEWDPLEP